ncbi:MAG TPA: dNTP triphosphohydrolase, partial [Verrucomicrobiaceae bacterium]
AQSADEIRGASGTNQTFYNDFDTARLHEERPRRDDEYRTSFQIDRDRIVHSDAFRRLQWKTQVFHSFLIGEYDFYRSRLTHSLEVAQIGRAICGKLSHQTKSSDDELRIDTDLVEAACLAHDLGHPPFGHTGERMLHELMKPFGGFEGNAQTLRILNDTLFGDGRSGMNPTRALMDAVMKYKTLYRDARGAKNHYLYDEQEPLVSFVAGNEAFPDSLPPGEPRNGFKSIECQIMDWSDDVAYSINDIADGIRSGMISLGNLERWAETRSASGDDDAQVSQLLRSIRSGKFEGQFARSIGDHIHACSVRRRPNPLRTPTRRHEFELVVEDAVRRRAELNKQIVEDLLFRSAKLQQLDHKAERIVHHLFQTLSANYIERDRPRLHLLSESVENLIAAAPDKRGRARVVCDWIANLTDRAAFQAHQRMFDSASTTSSNLS